MGAGILFPWNVLITETAYFNLRFHTPPFPQVVGSLSVGLCSCYTPGRVYRTRGCVTMLSRFTVRTAMLTSHREELADRWGLFVTPPA
eukprot:5050058-Pyramimonas_sp.AAC.1